MRNLKGLVVLVVMCLLVSCAPRYHQQQKDGATLITASDTLDHDTLLIPDGPLQHLDLQLLRMIDDVKEKTSTLHLRLEPQICLQGFSAAGDFVTRFSLLHPDVVNAAVVGGVVKRFRFLNGVENPSVIH